MGTVMGTVLRVAAPCVLAAALSGCEYLKIKGTDWITGADNQKSAAYLVQPSACPRPSDEVKAAVLPGFVVALAAKGADYLVSAIFDAAAAEVKRFAAEGQREYKATVLLKPLPTTDTRYCVVVVRAGALPADTGRIDIASPDYGSILMFSIEPEAGSSAQRIVPHLIGMNRPLARTKLGQPIDVSVAVVAKAYVEAPGKDPKIVTYLEHTFSIDGVPVRTDTTQADAKTPKYPERSPLLLGAPVDTRAVELTVAVVETGRGLPNVDRAKAEIEALKKAVGPAISDAFKSVGN